MGLLGAFLLDWTLLLVPALACGLLAVRLGVTHWLLLLTAAIAGSGVLALAVFWAYLVDNHLGRGFSLALMVLSALALADACRHGFAGWRALRPLLPLGALYTASSFFSAALAYLHVAFASNTNVAPNDFNTKLPDDNVLPLLFAKQLESGLRPLPSLLVRSWQSSDRPPLQTGYYLMQQSVLHTGHFNDYELLGILLQSLWIPGLWALLIAMGKRRRAVALCLTAVIFNGFIFDNTIFTWPKLIAAAGMMIVAALLCTPETSTMMRSRTAGVLAGLAIGTAMMAHPGSAFALLGIGAVVLVLWVIPRWRPAGWHPPTWRFLWPGAVVAAVVYEPWSFFYEKRYQPPANALTELQLAQIQGPVPGKTTTQVIVGAYRKAGLHGAIENKVKNFERPFENFLKYPRWCFGVIYHTLNGQHRQAANDANLIVHSQFFYIGTIVGVGCLGLAVLYGRALWELGQRLWAWYGFRRRTDGHSGGPAAAAGGPEQRRSRLPQLGRPSAYSQEYVLLAVIAVLWIAWCLIEFGPGTTVAHQGTYFIEPVLISLGVIGLWSVSPRLATVIVLLSAAFTLGLYEHFTPLNTVPNQAWAYDPTDPFKYGSLGLKTVLTGGNNTDPATAGAMALLVGSVVLCAVALWWIGRERHDVPGPNPNPGADGDTGADTEPTTSHPTVLAE